MAILKALDYIQNMESDEKIVLVHTDSKITLQLLQNKKKHTKVIDQIRTKVQEMEQREWRVEFRWIKEHAGHRGNEMADKQAKKAARNKNIEECYIKIPNSVVMSVQKVQSVKWWQREWTETKKRAITKTFFPKIEDRIKSRLNATPKFTAIITRHGNIKAYLHKYKIIDDPSCPCRKGPQTVQHIIFDCPLLEKEKEKLNAVVTRTKKWTVSCNKLGVKYHKNSKNT